MTDRVLLGRDRELGLIDALLGDAREGRGRGLLISGEAGIGKTSLLDEARERASGMRVIEAIGVEGELHLPFAALGEVAESLVDRIGELPPPQAEAMRAALALSSGPDSPRDRFAVCVGFLSLLRTAAEQEPLLLLLDDAQWLDQPSAECIGYAARRLDDSAIGLLAARRSGEGERPLPGVADELVLEGLSQEDSLALLHSGSEGISGSHAESVLTAANGNPLALRALPELLDPEQGPGDVAADRLLEPSHGLHQAFERRIADLDQPAQRALLVAAASGSGAAGPIVTACGEVGIDVEAIERAEAKGLIRVGETRIEFDHPLLRGTAYNRATAAERRAAHAALAGSESGDRRAWHLAAAAIGVDEGAASELEQAAERARQRGAKLSEAQALERAAELSADPHLRTRRLVDAGVAAHAAADRDRSLRLLRGAAETENPELLTLAQQMLAVVSLWGGRADEGYSMFVNAAEREATKNPVRAATLLADAAVAATAQGEYVEARARAEEANELLGDGGEPQERAVVLSALGWCLALSGESARATALFEQVEPLIEYVDPFSPAAQSIGLALNSRIFSEDYERARRECVAIVEALQEADALALISFPMAVGSDAAHRLGDWDAADAESAEALQLAVEAGERGTETMALVVKAWLAAGRGREQELEAMAERTFELADEGGLRSVALFVRAAQGFGLLGLARIDEAIAVLEDVAGRASSMGLEEPTLIPWIPDLVECYAHADRGSDAERMTELLERQAKRTGGSVAAALAARCRGLVEDDFESHFERALELHEEVSTPFERARTLLVLGSRRHRAGRRVEARESLYEALGVFRELRAEPWVNRAERELDAAGARPRDPVFDPDELTAQEIRVAEAVAAGATNREVAASLFLSEKTIEFHLGRVYRKLGIHSRTELATLVASGELDRQPAGR